MAGYEAEAAQILTDLGVTEQTVSDALPGDRSGEDRRRHPGRRGLIRR